MEVPSFDQSHRSDLNRRPLDYESSALPLSYGGIPSNLSGDEGNRTPDLCSAIAALSQLSYVPKTTGASGRYKTRTCDLHDVNVAL
jgi:hypothetical protein